MTIYRCKRCNYLYINGEQDIHFEKLEDNFKCPKCRASKNFFIEKNSK
ncbi:MAG: rubredoxin [Promethearchaeota archaeon]